MSFAFKRGLISYGLMIFLLVFGTGSLFAAAEKYAYVDVAKVFDDYQKTKDNDKTLQDAGKKKEEERNALMSDVKALKDELALLAEDAKAKKQETLETKVRELQDFDRDAKRELGEKRNKVVREIFKDIDDTVQRYGERKGLDMIFNERALLFHSQKFDVTQEILTELNKGYSKKKK